jgi:hypothetical protein
MRVPFVSRHALRESIDITRRALELAQLAEEKAEEAHAISISLLEDLREERARSHAVVEQLIAMKRDGFVLAPPAVAPSALPPNPLDRIPDVVWDAIREMAPSELDPLRTHLVTYALSQERRWATEANDLATEIRAGEDADLDDGTPE